MRDEILKSHPQARLRVYAVWFPVLPGDSSLTVDRRLLTDARVDNFWDPNRAVGNWFSEHVTDEPGVTWDAYFLFGSDATWVSSPSPIASSGSPVIGNRDSLSAAFDRLESAT